MCLRQLRSCIVQHGLLSNRELIWIDPGGGGRPYPLGGGPGRVESAEGGLLGLRPGYLDGKEPACSHPTLSPGSYRCHAGVGLGDGAGSGGCGKSLSMGSLPH